MIKIIKKINNIFLLYLLSLVLIISFHFIIRDSLFFYTKINYILYYLFVSSFLILILLLFYFYFFVKKVLFLEIYLKFAIFLLILNFFRSIFFIFENNINSALTDVIIFFISILFSGYITFKVKLEKLLINKSYLILKISSYLIFFILLFNFFNFIYQKKLIDLSIIKKNRNPVVLIIVDGLPKKFIKNYTNNDKDINIITRDIQNDYAIQNYHKYITPSPWTCGFFSNLYGLSPNNTFRRDVKFEKILSKKTFTEKNFFNELDNINATYSWAVSHSCAVPEGSAAAISDYLGFKSILTFSKVMQVYLEKIGLPSHSIINMKTFKGEPVAVHLKEQSFFKKIIDLFSESDDYNFQSHVLNKIQFSKKDFYIIHLNYSQWKYSELKDFKKPVDSLLVEVNNFFKIIKDENKFDNFNFVITSDHGFSFYKEDFGYGASHRLDVLEVPFLIIKKIDKKKMQTNNVQNFYQTCSVKDFQESLVDFFKENKELFLVNCSQDPKLSFSYPDDKKKTWNLTVFENDKKNIYNFYEKYFNIESSKNSKYINKNDNLLSFLYTYGIKY
jgi:hypothetical protein